MLEVILSFPSQWKALLSAICEIDPADSSLLSFDLENFVPRLPHQIALVIQVGINGINIHRVIVDEGASTCVMSSACWKAIGSLALNSFPNALEAFDGRELKHLGVLASLPINLQGNKISVKVEVIDAKLNYNILLSCSWTHAMLCVTSTLFRLLKFPHEGRILTVDQLSFFTSSSKKNVPYVDKIPTLESMGPRLFKDPTLMGIFPLPPPNTIQVNMISRSNDPWIIPSPKQFDSFGDSMPLSPVVSSPPQVNYVATCPVPIFSDSVVVHHVLGALGLDF